MSASEPTTFQWVQSLLEPGVLLAFAMTSESTPVLLYYDLD